MADLLLCEPTELYNILNQVSKLSRLAEPNYLCLLDVRPKRLYDESHVITAMRVKKKDDQYLIPESVDLECVRYCIVYDSNTSSLELGIRRHEDNEEEKSDDEEEETELLPGPAVEFAQILIHFTRQPVYVLKGGYECFSGLYHFFRTQKIIWMPQEVKNGTLEQGMVSMRVGAVCKSDGVHFDSETFSQSWIQVLEFKGLAVKTNFNWTSFGPQILKSNLCVYGQELDAFQPYPIEIVPGKIFLGKLSQACNARIHKDLKIKAHVNVSMESTPYFVGDENKLLHIKIEDSSGSSLFSSFRHICHFMEIHLRLQSVILVFSTRGISRSSAAVVAFLMHYNEETLKRSWAHVKKCKNNMRPNRGLVAQLLEWEKVIHGEYITDISNPIY